MKKSSHLKLWQQISLIILLGVVPMIAITLGVITVSINKDIDFGRWEAHGVTYQRPLQKLLDLVPRFGAVTAAEREKVKLEIESTLVSLRAVQVELGDALQFTPAALQQRQRADAHPDALTREWAEVTRDPSPERIAAMVGHIRQAISHVGDMSNLILDPDLDSYYLMDVTLCALPQTAERLASIAARLHTWIASGEVAGHDREIAAMAALLGEADIARIEGDIQTVLNEDAQFYGTSMSLQQNLPGARDRYLASNKALLAQMQEIASGSNTPAVATFDTAVWQARSDVLDFWNAAADELAVLIETRIASYQTKRTWSLLTLTASLVISFCVTAWFLRRLVSRLRTILQCMDNNARHVASLVGQVAATSDHLASSASEQAASIEESSASLEELASMSRSNVENAQRVAELVGTARRDAEGGESQTKALAAAMTALQASSAEVASIVKAINEIAFQTNILALNAAVEAARAGEAGAGFAVVADEVRSLARRSAEAANRSTAGIEHSIARANEGARISKGVETALSDILGRIREVDKLAGDVATASREQNQGVGQLNKAVSEMDRVTQSNAASAEEGSAVAIELHQQAQNLETAVHDMVALIEGYSATPAAVTPARHPEGTSAFTTPPRAGHSAKEIAVAP